MLFSVTLSERYELLSSSTQKWNIQNTPGVVHQKAIKKKKKKLLSYNPLLGLGTSGNLKSHLCWSIMLLQLITLWQLWSFVLTSVLFPPAAVGVPAVPMHNVPLPFCRCVNVGRNHLICGNGFQTTGTLNCASNAFFGSYFIFCSQQDILQ